LKAFVPFLCKEKAPKRNAKGKYGIAVLPFILLVLFFFRRFFFSLKRKSGK